MPIWRFYDYFPEGEGCPIRAWLDAQETEIRARFDATVAELGRTEDWSDPDLLSFGVFKRPEHAGLSQVKFYVIRENKKRHHRAVGRWRPEAFEFIFINGFQKNGRTPIPPNALDEAVRLLGELNDGRGEIHEHDLEEIG